MTDPRRPLALFDLDDTLCDYSGARKQRLAIAFGHAPGLDPSVIEQVISASIARHPHGSAHFPELLAEFGVDDPAIAGQAVAWYRENRFHGLRLFPEARDILESLRTSGYPIGIITNGPAETQRAKISLLGIDRLVDFAVVSGELGIEKPDPAIFAAALDLGGRAASEAIFIGDALEFDILGAHRAGIRSIWMNRAGDRPEEDDPVPDHTAANLGEVISILDRWPLR